MVTLVPHYVVYTHYLRPSTEALLSFIQDLDGYYGSEKWTVCVCFLLIVHIVLQFNMFEMGINFKIRLGK